MEYVCDTYHRYGREHCSNHLVHEEDLDKLIIQELLETKEMYQQNWDRLERFIAQWTPRAESTEKKIEKLRENILRLEEEIEVILMERIRDSANRERYDRMIEKRESEIAEIKKQIETLQNVSQVIRQRQAKLKKDISMINDILKDGSLTEAQLRMLVEKIYIWESDGRVGLEICIKAPFRDHYDVYENGQQIESYGSLQFDEERLGAIVYGEDYQE